MIVTLTWVSIIAGGILILMLILSVLGGLDLDLDVGSTDIETDAGGLGLIKGILTFTSVTSWVVKILLTLESNPAIAWVIGIVSGIAAFILLNYLLKLLISNEENVNWSMQDALFQRGEVYLKIPGETGSGIVNIELKGGIRELKAKTKQNEAIPTGESIVVVDIDGEYVIVKKDSN